MWLNLPETEGNELHWFHMTFLWCFCLLCINPWDIYASELKYITTVLMKNFIKCVLVWKFTLTLWNMQFCSLFPFCTVWLHLNMQSGEAGADKYSFRRSAWSHFCYLSMISFLFVSVVTVFFLLSVFLSSSLSLTLTPAERFSSSVIVCCLMHDVFDSPMAAIHLCVHVMLLSGALVELAHWPLTVDVVAMVKVARLRHPVPLLLLLCYRFLFSIC